jgi:hypothetical protein
MSMQEMWQWVHTCYGDELGLTSDDDDYIPPANEEDKLSGISVRLSVDSFSEVSVRLTLLFCCSWIMESKWDYHFLSSKLIELQ